jgi:exopolysaccharide biosynthesis polyprenyl glycosylphosphotransferase
MKIRANRRRVLVVGGGPLARVTVEDLRRRKCEVLGVLTLEGEESHPELGATVLGSASQLLERLLGQTVDEVYLAASVVRHHAELQRAIAACERLGTGFAVPAHVFRLNRALPATPGLGADGYIHYRAGFPRPVQEALKRSLDVAGSLTGLLLLAPLFLVVALLIKLESRGPVFFPQLRAGRNGRMFRMLKFRSMIVDAERHQRELLEGNEQEGPVFKIRGDPRITRIGAFIRRFSIDELPQLWNVLVGDMSIVGPRPPILREVAQYEPWQRRRLSVKPGLTCFWQVEGRNEIGFDEWMQLDVRYVDQWSLATDLRLIARTIPAVVSGSGAS